MASPRWSRHHTPTSTPSVSSISRDLGQISQRIARDTDDVRQQPEDHVAEHPDSKTTPPVIHPFGADLREESVLVVVVKQVVFPLRSKDPNDARESEDEHRIGL